MCVSPHWSLLGAAMLMAGLLHLPRPCHAQLQVEAVFDQLGVSGRIVFSQSSPQSNTSITVTLTGKTCYPTYF